MPDPGLPITELNLSVRTHNCLTRAGLVVVSMIVSKRPSELLAIRNFGRQCLDDLRQALIAAGYEDPWPELDGPLADETPSITEIGLSRGVAEALLAARRVTVARVLGTPADDLLGILSWEQYTELRRRLIELDYAEPGNIER